MGEEEAGEHGEAAEGEAEAEAEAFAARLNRAALSSGVASYPMAPSTTFLSQRKTFELFLLACLALLNKFQL